MRVIENTMGEWWIYPLVTDLGDRTIFGGISSTGEILANEFSNQTQATKRIVVSSAPIDDHNTPAIYAQQGRRFLMGWTHRNSATFLKFKVSDLAGSVESFATATEVQWDASGPTSYLQMHLIEHLSTPAADVFWVFTRCPATGWQIVPVTVTQSTGAISFGTVIQLWSTTEQTYLTTAPGFSSTNQKIRISAGYNPAGTTNTVRYFEIDCVTGAIASPVDTSLNANLNGSGLPLSDAMAPLLPQLPAGNSRRLFYTRSGPMPPAIAYAEWANTDPDNATYKVIAQNTGGTWSITEYGISGPRIGYVASANYIPGVVFPIPCGDDRVLVTRRIGSVSQAELYTGTQKALIARTTSGVLVRPQFAVNNQSRMVVFNVTYYGDDFRQFRAFAGYYGANTSSVRLSDGNKVQLVDAE